MPKNVVKRLQQIENDLKTVISIYEVSQKCTDLQEKVEIKENENRTQLQQISERIPEALASINGQPSQEKYSTVTEQKVAQSSCTLPSVCEVSPIKTKQKGVINKNSSDTNLTFYSEKSEAEKQNENVIAGKIHFVSREDSILKEYPDWLVSDRSNWFGSIKNSDKVKNNKGSLSIPSILKPKIESSFKEKDRKKARNTKNVQDVVSTDEKVNEPIEIRLITNQKNIIKDTTKTKTKVCKKEKEHQDSNADLNQKSTKHQNVQFCDDELSKVMEKSNEKLEKMKLSKELALNIAKHLKEKYEEIQHSKKELTEKLVEVQNENDKLKSELKNAQLRAEELKESQVNQMKQDVKTKEKLNILKARICELEKQHHEDLLEKQREIEKIHKARLVEIGNELKSKENQARDIQRLSNEKCELLAKNDELLILLNDRNLQMRYQYEKIRRLEEEVQTHRENLEKKAKVLAETNKELELTLQTSSDLEQKVIFLGRNNENFEETKKNLIKQIEELKEQLNLNQEEMKKLKDENSNLKAELENEKDGLLIKAKIIEDQQETIKQLKEKSEEAKALLKKKESLERILNTEMEEKLELQEAVKRLKNRKEELKEKIKLLENDLLLAPQEVARDLQKTKIILFELENQVYNKQKEWELQLHSLIREKEQACSVAEYATKKLIQTSSEFQKQAEAHKRLRQIIAANLAEKGKFDECIKKNLNFEKFPY